MHAVDQYLQRLSLPDPYSHKGQNGKLLIIGGSELFHAASKWSLDVASKFVDMVFYASVPSNNNLVLEAKKNFWNGIVIERHQIEDYLQEADAVLIGPGMERGERGASSEVTEPTEHQWNHDTGVVATYLLSKYSHKKWVIDAGALQMISPQLLTERCIITPHLGELDRLLSHLGPSHATVPQLLTTGCTVVLKGHTDYIYKEKDVIEITGGSPGMTKGGTGDVLAGLIAALYATQDIVTAAVVGSFINKKTGERLEKNVGPFFNASDLVQAIPQVFWDEYTRVKGIEHVS